MWGVPDSSGFSLMCIICQLDDRIIYDHLAGRACFTVKHALLLNFTSVELRSTVYILVSISVLAQGNGSI
jgi:hypothetical protein